jgi:hypothetical protein
MHLLVASLAQAVTLKVSVVLGQHGRDLLALQLDAKVDGDNRSLAARLGCHGSLRPGSQKSSATSINCE